MPRQPTDSAPQGDTLPLTRGSAEVARRALARQPAISLVIHHRDGVEVVPLRPDVPVLVGRGRPADVVVPDGSLSRVHARFVLHEDALVVEDLGSTNGTCFRGARVQRAELRPGDVVELGSVLVSPHMRSALEPAFEGLAGHDAFRLVLDRDLVRARYFGEPLAILLVRASAPAGDRAHLSRWWRRVQQRLRPIDTAAPYGPHALEIVMPRTSDDEAMARAKELVGLGTRGVTLVCGVATYPASGASADELLALVRSAALEATPERPVCLSPPTSGVPERARPSPGDVVVQSPAMREIFATLDRLAHAPLPVLVLGETGTGKEVIARALHERGPRAAGPMACVNCGAIPSQLVEATLFGHARGAFTGAVDATRGVLGAAHGGTVLLDEIGELPLAAQAALLRVLETGKMRPVGADEEVSIDVRVVAATHRDIEAMCDTGAFRRDLFFRLNAFTLSLPPLCERREDIAPLARHFLAGATAFGPRVATRIADEAMAALEAYRWPGNVRELRNVIERAVVVASGEAITLDDLPHRVCGGGPAGPATVAPSADADDAEDVGDLRERVRAYEARLIAAALRRADGNLTEAARLLSVPVRTLTDKMTRLGVKKPG
jgi:DNA-binding NtrC family response regulator